jgi:hypothetical protein
MKTDQVILPSIWLQNPFGLQDPRCNLICVEVMSIVVYNIKLDRRICGRAIARSK